MSGSGIFSSLLAILLFILFTCSASGDGECKKSPIKTLNGKMEVSWKFDKANGKVVFTVTVHGMLDSQRAIEGWVALGFMQGPSKSPPAKIGAAADFVVTFLKSKRKVGIKVGALQKSVLQVDKSIFYYMYYLVLQKIQLVGRGGGVLREGSQIYKLKRIKPSEINIPRGELTFYEFNFKFTLILS